ncbi:MAG: putative toxin-antitoxin system toxin component, PIN family [Proteobacteria bacterium]|nr:putative toxin-antitoxin system toxin component, PIN family [Pseudomonadota bacterium]MBU2226829.1 putative toxin-antitoxin system toxin component, PIN family [Pseudomonadota bacterium]MBU2262094.1 putative toxin-antitoxin system toxin component, PIN family [Pseudomonadota bacterium]
MGEKQSEVTRAVLDTNVLVSALLFPGELERIVTGWKSGAFVPVFSRETFDEFRKVLAYPKFELTAQEIVALIEDEVLPFCEVVDVNEEIRGVCRDPADDPFLTCAVAANADCIVSGDRDLLDLGSFRNIPIITAAAFLR